MTQFRFDRAQKKGGRWRSLVAIFSGMFVELEYNRVYVERMKET